jgi:hypothetical protein
LTLKNEIINFYAETGDFVKKYAPFSLLPLVLFSSCLTSQYGFMNDQYTRVEKLEITNEKTVHIYFSGQTPEFTITDIIMRVNDSQDYYIAQAVYVAFKDTINGLVRYRCTLNKDLTGGDKVTVTGAGRAWGTVTEYYLENK